MPCSARVLGIVREVGFDPYDDRHGSACRMMVATGRSYGSLTASRRSLCCTPAASP